jgi:folate-dependent phosphoribosylglycinamide formyltransferase PurN
MKITVFTSNQPRHLSLIADLATIADQVFAIQECNTVFPGRVADFLRASEVMENYFSKVIDAEKEIFGGLRFSATNARTLSIKSGDLNRIDIGLLAEALQSDIYIVFGASFIKGALLDFLIANKAINIHMGISPYYRGSSCNFWAIYDENPDLVGATIHLLSSGLDSGAMLFHALPKVAAIDPFLLGFHAVQAAHRALIESIKSGRLFSLKALPQDRNLEIRYSRHRDFTDEVAKEYLERNLSARDIDRMLKTRRERQLVEPQFF